MEYMDKGTLRDRIRENDRVEIDFAVRVTYFIALALREMHDINMVHRDVSPDNIFFDSQENIKLGDLGLAGRLDILSAPNFKMYYSAPEIFQNSQMRHTPASDIYSLGAVLFEMLGGDLTQGHLFQEVDRLSDLPDYFKSILKEMLHPDPDSRCSADKVVKTMGQRLTLHKLTSMPIGDLTSIREIVLKGFLQTKREKDFLDIWEKEKEAVYAGLDNEMQQTISKAVYFSLIPVEMKASNCYLGIEHILWVLLEALFSFLQVFYF